MRLNSLTLTVPPSAAVGAGQSVRDLQDKAVQLSGTFVGSFTIEISLDGGANYWPVVTGLNGPGLTLVPYPATHLRLRNVTLTSGTPTAVVAGFDANG